MIKGTRNSSPRRSSDEAILLDSRNAINKNVLKASKSERDVSSKSIGHERSIKAVYTYSPPTRQSSASSALGTALSTISGFQDTIKRGTVDAKKINTNHTNGDECYIENLPDQAQEGFGLNARLKVAEKQLRTTREALQRVEDEQRDMAANFAELQQKFNSAAKERDEALVELDHATKLTKRAYESAETANLERESAKNEANIARQRLDKAEQRIREVESLKHDLDERQGRVEELSRQSEAEAARLKTEWIELHQQQRKLEVLTKTLEDREREIDEKKQNLENKLDEVSTKEKELGKLQLRYKEDNAELERKAKTLELKSEELESIRFSLEQEKKNMVKAREMFQQEQKKLDKELQEKTKSLENAEREKLQATKLAEESSARARDAEASVRECQKQVEKEQRQLKEIKNHISEEKQDLNKTINLHEGERKKLEDVRARIQRLESEVNARLLAAKKAEKAARTAQEVLEKTRTKVTEQQEEIDKTRKALEEQEIQTQKAAEVARQEQVILACARRDSVRAAIDLRRKHLKAAAELDKRALQFIFKDVESDKELKEGASKDECERRFDGNNAYCPTLQWENTGRAPDVGFQDILNAWRAQVDEAIPEEASLNDISKEKRNNNAKVQASPRYYEDIASEWPAMFSFSKSSNQDEGVKLENDIILDKQV